MTRSFERMLKDAPGRKYTALQTALKAYLGLFFIGPVVSFFVSICSCSVSDSGEDHHETVLPFVVFVFFGESQGVGICGFR